MRREGFSLVEISVVLVVVATMLAGVLPAITESQKSNAADETAERMEQVKQALLTYRAANSRVPCPSDISLGVNTANFGKEGATQGTCTGGTPAANFSSGNVVGGGVPVKELGLPDEYAFDGWGRRMVYHVDKRLTLATTYSSTTTGSITVKDGASTPSDRTTTAAYALVSSGPNGHGAYTRAGTRFSFGTTNARELENCDCTSAGVAGAYNTTLHQYMATPNTNPQQSFDDIVIYGSRSSLDLLAGGGGGGSSFWADAGSGNINNTNAGNVGIGTAVPGGYKLAVVQSSPGSRAYVRFDNTSGTSSSTQLDLGGSTGRGWSLINDFAATNTDDFSIYQASATARRLVINSTGNVGIGTLMPTFKVEIDKGASVGSGIRINGTNDTRVTIGNGMSTVWSWANGWATAGDFSLVQEGVSGSVIYVKPGGNVGIGTTSPAAKLQVIGGLRARQGAPDASDNTDRGYAFGADGDTGVFSPGAEVGANGNVALYSNGVERMRVDVGGNVGIGITNPQAKLDVSSATGSQSAAFIRAADGATVATDWPGGWGGGLATWDIVGGSTYFSGYITRSDRRYKKDIKPLDVGYGLKRIKELKPVSYRMKDAAAPKDKQYGFIAQDVQKIFPDLVTTGAGKDKRLGLSYNGLLAPIVLAIQELNTKVDDVAAGKPVKPTPRPEGQKVQAPDAAAPLVLHQLPRWLQIALIAPWLPWIGVTLFGWPMRRRT